MTIADLLAQARAVGVTVYRPPDGDGLKLRGPTAAVAEWAPRLRSHREAIRAWLSPPPLTPDEQAAITERVEERAAIQTHDGGLLPAVAETQARTAMRVYRVQVAMGPGESPRWMTLLAPGCDLVEATTVAEDQFGTARVLTVVEQERPV